MFTVVIALAFGATLELPALIGGAIVIAGVWLTLHQRKQRQGVGLTGSAAGLPSDTVEPIAHQRPE